MKIAFFVNTYPALSQTFILSQMTCLSETNQVDVFTRNLAADQESSSLTADPALQGTVHFYRPYLAAFEMGRLRKYARFFYNFATALLRNPKKLARFLRITAGGRKIESFYRFNDVLIFLHGPKLRYEIIHCHFGPNGGLAALLKEIGIMEGKLVTTFHGYDMSKYLDHKGRNAYELLFKVGDLFLPVSERWREELIALGCDPERIRVHRMGVDLEQVGDGLRTVGEETRLLSVARLVEKKGLSYGIRAVAEAMKSCPQLRYRIVGDGPLRASLEKLIAELGATERIELLGWKSQQEVFELLQETDIFLAPSVTDAQGDQEGIPVTLMEAMAHGLPVLSTWHSGIPELVQDGTSGYLVPERDVATLADRLADLATNPEIRSKMGAAGRSIVASDYDNRKLNARLLTMFQVLERETRDATDKAEYA